MQIGRSIGVHLCDIGHAGKGLGLSEMAIGTTQKLRFGKEDALQQWRKFRDETMPLPEVLDDALKRLRI